MNGHQQSSQDLLCTRFMTLNFDSSSHYFPGVFCNLFCLKVPSPFSQIISQVEQIALKHVPQKHTKQTYDNSLCVAQVLIKLLLILQLNDAYEEVDEQRQVVAQWKRKTQKVNGELNDTKLLLEEQTSRNVLLEKKQRKFDAEIGLLQEDKKQEMSAREKLQREVDSLKAQKYGLEEQIHVSTKLFLTSANYLHYL